jgi:hypothetical protein
MRRFLLSVAGTLAFTWTVAAHAQPGPIDPASPPDIVPPSEVNKPPPAPNPIPEPVNETPGTLAPIGPLPATPVPMRDSTTMRMGPLGTAFLVGGGFEDFTNSNLRGMTSGGGSWNARAIAGMRQYVGLEAAYVGAARSINTLGLNSDTNLVSNGLEGAVRINLPVLRGLSLLEPFGFVGLGWQHYSLTNTNSNTSDIANNDDVMSMPVGAGLEFAYGMFMADARFTYRETYYNDLLRTSGGKLNNWGVGGQLGVTF